MSKQIIVTEEQAQMIGNMADRKRRSLRSFMRAHGNDLGSKFFHAAMDAENDLSDLLNQVSNRSEMDFGPSHGKKGY